VRSPSAPEVPTLMELGYDVAIRSGIAIGGPAGIPEEIIKVLEDAFLKGMDNPDFIEVTNRLFMPTIKMNSKQLTESLEKDYVFLKFFEKAIKLLIKSVFCFSIKTAC
jgi:tripartite-type tricarboxylate transporter receptor subunit TctC